MGLCKSSCIPHCISSCIPCSPEVEHMKKLKDDLRKEPEIITGGVKEKVTVEDTVVIRSEDLEKELMALEVNIDRHLAYSVAMSVVREAAETMFVTLRDTKEMEEIERRYGHQKIERGEDGKLYGVEIHYIIKGQQSPSAASHPPSKGGASSPVMMIAYRILVKTLEGNTKDVPDKS